MNNKSNNSKTYFPTFASSHSGLYVSRRPPRSTVSCLALAFDIVSMVAEGCGASCLGDSNNIAARTCATVLCASSCCCSCTARARRSIASAVPIASAGAAAAVPCAEKCT